MAGELAGSDAAAGFCGVAGLLITSVFGVVLFCAPPSVAPSVLPFFSAQAASAKTVTAISIFSFCFYVYSSKIIRHLYSTKPRPCLIILFSSSNSFLILSKIPFKNELLFGVL